MSMGNTKLLTFQNTQQHIHKINTICTIIIITIILMSFLYTASFAFGWINISNPCLTGVCQMNPYWMTDNLNDWQIGMMSLAGDPLQ